MEMLAQRLLISHLHGKETKGILHAMVNQDKYSKNQVVEMRGMLRHEFWEEHSLLPADWRMMN